MLIARLLAWVQRLLPRPLAAERVQQEILLALSRCTTRHGRDTLTGYEALKEVRASTGQRFALGPGTIHLAITKLIDQQLVEKTQELSSKTPNGESRTHYRLTSAGAVAADNTAHPDRSLRERRGV